MPELPEVERFRRLAQRRSGRTIERVSIGDPGMLEGFSPARLRRCLKGARIGPVRRHGKQLLFGVSGAGCLALHFGTNGSLRLLRADEPDPRFVRLSLVLTGGERLAYLNPRRIGNVRFADDADAFIAKSGLGPDALDRRFDRAAMAALFAGRKRDVKSILMDQERVAGIGNLYSDEILFQARVHPSTSGAALGRAEVARLHAATKRVLRAAIKSAADAEQAPERLPRGFLLRDRHRGGHCPRCGTALATLRRGGRTAYFCPRCQRRPERVSA